MFTQQAQLLANQYGRVPGAPIQGMLQAFANCAQPLATRGPVTFNGAAAYRAPRAGVLTGPANLGGIGMPSSLTGNTLTDYYAGWNQSQFNQYPGTAWNNQFFKRLGDNGAYTGDGTYWGGDDFYGPTYLAGDTLNANGQFNPSAAGNYDYFNSAYNTPVNNQLNQNVSNWYSQQFVDQSFNDFSTHLNTTTNQYVQQINNFAGDTYLDNTVTSGWSFNNNVVNSGEVVNEGEVKNQGGFYIDASKTFVTNSNTATANITLNEYIALIINAFFGAGPPLPPNINFPAPIDNRKFIKNFRDILGVTVEYDKAISGVVNDDCTVTITDWARTKAKATPLRGVRQQGG